MWGYCTFLVLFVTLFSLLFFLFMDLAHKTFLRLKKFVIED